MSDLRLRRADMTDAERLFEWRNDPTSRRNSLAQEPIPWSRHVEWLSGRLASAETRLYIAEVQGEPVGTVRIDTADEAVISVAVAPRFRGQGLAAEIIRAATRDCAVPVVAQIRRTNLPSIRAFERAGFALAAETFDVLTYRLLPVRNRTTS